MTSHVPSTSAALGQHIAELHAEAGGVMALELVGQADMPGMVAAALAGDAEAARLCDMVADSLDAIENAAPSRRMVCATCDRELRDVAFTFALALPTGDNPHHGLAMAVCGVCGPTREAARTRALQAMRAIWPDARPITLHNGGRA